MHMKGALPIHTTEGANSYFTAYVSCVTIVVATIANIAKAMNDAKTSLLFVINTIIFHYSFIRYKT